MFQACGVQAGSTGSVSFTWRYGIRIIDFSQLVCSNLTPQMSCAHINKLHVRPQSEASRKLSMD
jgi:hypothetical protein